MNKPSPDTLRTFLADIAATPKDSARSIAAAKCASVFRMLTAVYANQTADEQVAQTTNKSNGKGFTGCDARILSDIAQKSARYGSLTGPQARFVAGKLVKYAVQISKAYETHSKAAQVPQAVVEPAPAPIMPGAPLLVTSALAAQTSRYDSNARFAVEASRSNANTAKKYDLLGSKLEKSRKGSARREVTLVDGVNTASELAFEAAFSALSAEVAQTQRTAQHVAAIQAA